MHLQTEALRDTWKRLCCFETCSASESFFRTQNPSSIRRPQRYMKALLGRPGAILGGLKAVMGASGRSVGFLGQLHMALRDFLGCLGRSGWSWGGLGGSRGALGGVLGTSRAVLLRSWGDILSSPIFDRFSDRFWSPTGRPKGGIPGAKIEQHRTQNVSNAPGRQELARSFRGRIGKGRASGS